MKVVFVSNYYNHHQAPFSEAMDRLTNGGYQFVETAPMEEERSRMGWGEKATPSFVVQAYRDVETLQNCRQLILEADIVIAGSAPEHYIKDRLESGKVVFRYSERWYKTGFEWWKWPKLVVQHHLIYGRYRNTYLLCASAYAAGDCAKTFLFRNRAYKWGYFPKTIVHQDVDGHIAKKEGSSILWVGRMLDWKHPELAVLVAKQLKEVGYSFVLRMIGDGERRECIEAMIQQYDLQDCVQLLGFVSPERVREYMDRSEIYLFTSDRNEGWGAVLNESMNAACAVVADNAIGSVPFLIHDHENGLVYHGDLEELVKQVKFLIENPDERCRMASSAYDTIVHEWNAEIAAERFINLTQNILGSIKHPNLYEAGPCSKAKILQNGWYKL